MQHVKEYVDLLNYKTAAVFKYKSNQQDDERFFKIIFKNYETGTNQTGLSSGYYPNNQSSAKMKAYNPHPQQFSSTSSGINLTQYRAGPHLSSELTKGNPW